MKVKFSKNPKDSNVEFGYPCFLVMGDMIVFASSSYGGFDIEYGNQEFAEESWAKDGWTLYTRTVTISNN